jgi:putative serine protease PepD
MHRHEIGRRSVGVGPVRRLASLACALAVAVVWAPPGVASVEPSPVAVALQSQLVQVVKAVAPQIVLIETPTGLGSGVVFDASGDVVTNAHVVGASKTFLVSVSTGLNYPGRLVGVFRGGDLAVVRIAAPGLVPATFADSAKLEVGDLAIAMGNPLGLRSSVTQGIVSALGRTESEGGGVVLPNVIQTSADINPGNSGGALLDIAGNVIGIPTLAALNPENGAAAPGIGFAIPSNTVVDIATQLIRFGRVVNSGRAYLGIRAVTLPGDLGVYVGAVVPKGPAARAGIQPRDVILAVGQTPTPTADALAIALAESQPGASVTVTLVRGGKPLKRQVTLGLQPG